MKRSSFSFDNLTKWFQEPNLEKKQSPILHVQPVGEQAECTDINTDRLDVTTKEEGDARDMNKNVSLAGALEFEGVELGPNGEVPEGFRKDDDGNVIVSCVSFFQVCMIK